MLQSEEPLIYLLYKRQQRFMNKLASKFVKPDIIRNLKEANKSFSELDISTENQKEGKIYWSDSLPETSSVIK